MSPKERGPADLDTLFLWIVEDEEKENEVACAQKVLSVAIEALERHRNLMRELGSLRGVEEIAKVVADSRLLQDRLPLLAEQLGFDRVEFQIAVQQQLDNRDEF